MREHLSNSRRSKDQMLNLEEETINLPSRKARNQPHREGY